MNKRILDGAALWKSDKMARIQPEWMRAEYANWIPLALANGSFEVDPRRIWATVYSYNRPDISLDDTEEIRREFCRVGLLFLWPDESSGKVWGYFTGIEKPGRLPPKSRLEKKHEPIGPTPPANTLGSYMALTRSKPLDAAVVAQWLANGCLGFGSGLGLGSGSGEGSRALHAPNDAEPSAPGACEDLLRSWNANRGPLPEVLKLTKSRKQKVLARVRSDPNFPKTFNLAVLKACETPFCCGGGERGWRASFDWMIANDTNCVAILEGKYDSNPSSKGGIDPNERTHENLRAAGIVH